MDKHQAEILVTKITSLVNKFTNEAADVIRKFADDSTATATATATAATATDFDPPFDERGRHTDSPAATGNPVPPVNPVPHIDLAELNQAAVPRVVPPDPVLQVKLRAAYKFRVGKYAGTILGIADPAKQKSDAELILATRLEAAQRGVHLDLLPADPWYGIPPAEILLQHTIGERNRAVSLQNAGQPDPQVVVIPPAKQVKKADLRPAAVKAAKGRTGKRETGMTTPVKRKKAKK